MSSDSPCQLGAVAGAILGMRTWDPFVSNTRGPAARNTDAASSGWTRMRWTCSAVSSGVATVTAALTDMEAPP